MILLFNNFEMFKVPLSCRIPFFLIFVQKYNYHQKFQKKNFQFFYLFTAKNYGLLLRRKFPKFSPKFFLRTEIFPQLRFLTKIPILAKQKSFFDQNIDFGQKFRFFLIVDFFFRKYIFWLQKWNLRHRLP